MPCLPHTALDNYFQPYKRFLNHVSYHTFLCHPLSHCEDHKRWKDKPTFDEYLSSKTPYVALLKAGDLIVYDPRILHCGAENEPTSGNTRPSLNQIHPSPFRINLINLILTLLLP